MKKILVTGGTGFVGKILCEELINRNYSVNVSTRNMHQSFVDGVSNFDISEINNKTNWSKALIGVDCIIHCAAKTNEFQEKRNDELTAYRKVNTLGTKNLAEQASINGIRRLIFLSSIKVNGEKTHDLSSYKVDHIPKPENAYSISKWEAEQALWMISKRTGLEIVIIRAPLVYGNGAKGNLARLVKLVKSGIPIPFSNVNNQRSMIGIDNLVDLLTHCIDHPNASGKTFLASDGEDLSTSELIKLIASSMGKKANLFPLPIFMLKFLGSIFGKSEEINRLVGSLRIDNNYTKEILNWKPPLSIKEGIRRMVQGK